MDRLLRAVVPNSDDVPLTRVCFQTEAEPAVSTADGRLLYLMAERVLQGANSLMTWSWAVEPGTGVVYYVMPDGETWFANSAVVDPMPPPLRAARRHLRPAAQRGLPRGGSRPGRTRGTRRRTRGVRPAGIRRVQGVHLAGISRPLALVARAPSPLLGDVSAGLEVGAPVECVDERRSRSSTR